MELRELNSYLKSLMCNRFVMTKCSIGEDSSHFNFIDKHSDKLIHIIFLPIYDKCFLWVTSRIYIDGITVYDTIETKSMTTLKKKLKEFGMYPHLEITSLNI